MVIAPDYYLYDGDPDSSVIPCRPSVDQLGGGQWIDDAEYPPDPQTMPYAASLNQMQNIMAGLCRIIPVARIGIGFSGGSPVVSYFQCMTTLLDSADLTVSRYTTGATGDISIVWPANKFPVKTFNPSGLTINEDVSVTQQRAMAITNGVRVITSASGGATDAGFTVEIHGQ